MASGGRKVHDILMGEATSSQVSAMDGINPTLAFAALFFGLSGNPRDANNDQTAALEIEDGSGCPTLIVSGEPAQLPSQEMWAEEFWSTATSGATLPDSIDSSWTETALLETKRSQLLADPVPAAADHGSDLLMRRTVAASKSTLVATPGIGPCRTKP